MIQTVALSEGTGSTATGFTLCFAPTTASEVDATKMAIQFEWKVKEVFAADFRAPPGLIGVISCGGKVPVYLDLTLKIHV